MQQLPVSDRAFGRLLKEAILLTSCHGTLMAILRYAETHSADGIDLSALDLRAWEAMKLRIDSAARRSASARAAAARRKANPNSNSNSKPKSQRIPKSFTTGPNPIIEDEDDPHGLKAYIRKIRGEDEETLERERQRQLAIERERNRYELHISRRSAWDGAFGRPGYDNDDDYDPFDSYCVD